MPNIRIGFSSDFVLKNGVVGLGTTVGSTTDGKLELGDGDIRGNFSVSGVATFTAYGGFVAQKQHVNKPAVIGFGTVGLNTAGAAIGVGATHITNQYYETETGFTDLGGVHHGDDQYFNTLSEDLIVEDGQILNITNTEMVGVTPIGEYDPHTHSSYVCAGSLEQVSVTDHFSVPNGGINDRQETPIEGTVRFNTDLNTLEFFNGNEWRQFTYNQGQSGRALFGGGQDPSAISGIDVLNIISLGNSNNFGNLSVVRRTPGACSSEIRGLFGGGSTPSNSDVIDYVTIASEGNAIDFGNLTASTDQVTACSSSTRGLFGGGESPSITNVISYVEISTTGNSLDFGDLSENKRGHSGMASATRGFFCGGNNPGSTTIIDFVTIASKGNAVIFGNDITNAPGRASSSNSQKGILYSFGDDHKDISSITLASEGNAIYFGDLSIAATRMSATGSQTRSVILLGEVSPFAPTYVNTVEFVLYSSSGNSQDFGDLSRKAKSRGALSDSHGGLGGF